MLHIAFKTPVLKLAVGVVVAKQTELDARAR